MLTVGAFEAKNTFGSLLDRAEAGEEILITRHGRPAVFVVSHADMEDLLDARQRRSEAVADLEAWRARAEASTSPAQKAAAAALTDEDVNRMVHELR